MLVHYAISCSVGHFTDDMQAFLTRCRLVRGIIDMFHARLLYVWISKSGVDKCAACSTTSLELILFNVVLGNPKANRWWLMKS